MFVKNCLTNVSLISAVVASFATGAIADVERPTEKLDFEGRYIVSVSDADMLASAYVNGRLGPKEGQDSLSVIALNDDPGSWTAVETPASNSVAGPPAALDITPDGRYAFVIETWTQRPDDGAEHVFADLRHGTLLNVFDLIDPASPKLLQTIETLERPDAVRVSSDGRLVAVMANLNGAGKVTPIAIYPFENGALGSPETPQIPGVDPSLGRFIDVDWHPSEPVMAIIDERQNTVRFLRVSADLTLEAVGNVVDLERTPFRVEFTPDGRHVVINALYWGADIAGRWIEAPRGSIQTIRYKAEEKADGSIRHAFVSRITTGVSPEGLAVSPDGTMVVTTNLERSYLPYEDSRITWFSSITLAALDVETGQLTSVGTFSYNGILPEAAVFDNSGEYLAIANYDHFDPERKGGSVDIWRIQADPLNKSNIQLVKTGYSVPVTRGVHSMVIAR